MTEKIRWALIGCGDIAEKSDGPRNHFRPEVHIARRRSPEPGESERLRDPTQEPDVLLHDRGSAARPRGGCRLCRDAGLPAQRTDPPRLRGGQARPLRKAYGHERGRVRRDGPVRTRKRRDAGRVLLSPALPEGDPCQGAPPTRGHRGAQVVRIDLRGWYYPAPDDPKAWRVNKSQSGGGVLMDVGSHRLDLLVNFFGLPDTVAGRAKTAIRTAWMTRQWAC